MPTILLAGCAILRDGKLLLVRKKDKDIWELPGGTVKSKADCEATAIEKTAEQISIEPTIIQQFTVLEYQKNETNIEASIFECDIKADSSPVPGGNIEEATWFELDRLKEGKENIGDDVKEILEEL